ncbi:MAG: Uncharacterised protein [Oceanospirillaceae bacterium UBA2001]|nr:MAG: Uncharacterised protein [Oceanospirillaceae bacterium UBA2001]
MPARCFANVAHTNASSAPQQATYNDHNCTITIMVIRTCDLGLGQLSHGFALDQASYMALDQWL